MHHYIELHVLPDAEMPTTFLINAAYTKIHKELHNLNSKNIGISFPNYKILLGNLIRIHGEDENIKHFVDNNWLGGLSGYCKISKVLETPSDTKHRTVSRWRSNMSESHFRRLLKRGSANENDYLEYKTKMSEAQKTKLPYLELLSTSTGNRYRRYIKFGELLNEPVKGKFDHFGLSKTATIPWF